MCKLGRDTEDLELQFSAAVAKVMIVVICANSEKNTKGLKHQFSAAVAKVMMRKL